MEENIINNQEKNVVGKRGKLAVLSLIFFLVRIGTLILTICTSLFQGFLSAIDASDSILIIVSMFSFLVTILNWIPWSIVSLILAIIGKVKDKDRMSTVMLIINIVYISLQVLLAIGGILFITLGIIAVASYY